jgi:hypothetical protein
MPRYFFHVYHDRTELDFVGEELPDKHVAWHEATVIAGRTLQSLDGKLQPDREWWMSFAAVSFLHSRPAGSTSL